MKCVIQRVYSANCVVNDEIVGEINKGLVIYLGVSKNFDEKKIDWIIDKILNLKLWRTENKFDLSVEDILGDILVISQFTLFGDSKKGTKLNFNDAMNSNDAKIVYENFILRLKDKCNLNIQTGVFGALMEINQKNDGPVTIIIEK